MPYKIAAIILAAGRSERMGTDNKLLADIGGKPMVSHVIDNVIQSGADPIIVVTGHEAENIQTTLANQSLEFVENPNYAKGLSTSLKVGIETLGDDVDACFICLGDMPLVTAKTLKALMAAFAPTQAKTICVPVHENQQGNPILWGREHFPDLLKLSGDQGAKSLLADNAAAIAKVEAGPEVLRDADHAAALAALRREMLQ